MPTPSRRGIALDPPLDAAYRAAFAAGKVPPLSSLLRAAMRTALASAGLPVPVEPAPSPRTARATAARWPRAATLPTCDACHKPRRDVRPCGRDADGEPDAPDLCFPCRKDAARAAARALPPE